MQTDILGADTPPHCARGRVCYGGAECGCELGESGWMAGSRVEGCGLSGSLLVPFCSLSCWPCLGCGDVASIIPQFDARTMPSINGHQRRVEGTADIRSRVQRPTALRWSRLPGCVARLTCGGLGRGVKTCSGKLSMAPGGAAVSWWSRIRVWLTGATRATGHPNATTCRDCVP